MLIEAKKNFYDISFKIVQVEITGRCNMNCKHCRASDEKRSDMSIFQIMKGINMALKHKNDDKISIILSGGEPLLHNNFVSVLQTIKEKNIGVINITTNGSLVDESLIPFLKETTISVSLDSIKTEVHDAFRGYKGAFNGALNAMNLLIRNNIKTRARVSVLPNEIDLIPEMANFIYQIGVPKASFSSIGPSGNALKNAAMIMNSNQKKNFLELLFELRDYYEPKGLHITTSDPLQYFCNKDVIDDIGLNGCTAGIAGFNIRANGDMTPCAMLNYPIMNIFKLTEDEMEYEYKNNKIILNFIERKFGGKCKKCQNIMKCGGCRARALGINNDILGEDPECWL